MVKEISIMYLSKTMDYGGTERIVMDLCLNLKEYFRNIYVCSSGGIYEKKLEENNIIHLNINNFDNKNPMVIIMNIYLLYKYVKKYNIDIIHSQHRVGTLLALIVSKFVNVKVIHTSHNVFKDKVKLSFLGKNIIAVGEKVKENLINDFKIDSNKIQVIYNGVGYAEEPIAQLEELNEWKMNNYFIIGNIGRITQQKGMEYFIRSIPEIIKSNEKVRFVIIGDGELRVQIEKLIDDLKIGQYIKLLGFKNNINNVIKNLDLVVLSSLWEGFPLTPLEVFANGKTIVATNVDGTPEIIKNLENGILVEPKNSKQICKGILRLVNDRELLGRLEKKSKQDFKDKFTLNIMIDKYKRYYKQNLS